MQFRLQLKALFSAALVLGAAVMAPAQSSGPGQAILFSSPDGQTGGNAALPAAQAPAPQGLAMPDDVPASLYSPHLPGPAMPSSAPPAIVMNRNSSGLADPEMQPQTTAEIMGVPSLQQIFGLPKEDDSLFNQKKSLPQNAPTNSFAADDSAWTEILSSDLSRSVANQDEAARNSRADKNPQAPATGFFDSSPADDLFAHHDKDQSDSAFGAPVFGQVSLPSSTPSDGTAQFSAAATPSPASGYAPGSFSPGSSSLNSGFSSPFNSQSPFAPATFSSASQLPQLPTVPSLPGRKAQDTPPATPSWEPKPAPWLSTVPPMGTMEQRKF